MLVAGLIFPVDEYDWVSLQEGFDEIDKQLDKLVRNRRVVRLRRQNKHLNPEFD